MCFLIDQKNNIPIIANKDITVYKIGFYVDYLGLNLFSSYFRDFKYAKDELCELDEEFPTIEEEKGINVVNRGFHSFSSINQRVKNMLSLPLRLGIFIIPTGALYLQNKELNETISNKIIFKGLTNV